MPAAQEQKIDFRPFVENTLDLVAVLTAEGRFQYASPSYLETLGFGPEELVGHTALPLLHPEDVPRMEACLASILREPGARETIELRVQHRDGRWRYLEAKARNLLDDPRVRGILFNARDVTERVEAQQALHRIRDQQDAAIAAGAAELTQAQADAQERERSFRLLFENNPLPMWVFDAQTLHFLEVNEAAVAQYGYTREEFLRMQILDIRPAEERGMLQRHLEEPRPSLRPTSRWRHRRRDGSILHVDVVSHAFRFQDRPGVLVVAIDVTERLQAEQERDALLRQERAAREEAHAARERLEFLFRSMSTMLVHGSDYAASLRHLAEVVVPALADWCTVDVVEEGRIVRLAAAHRDPAKAGLIEALQRHYAPDAAAGAGVPNVLRTAQPERYQPITPALLARMTQDEEHLRLVEALGVADVLVVPLVAREGVLGALTLVMGGPGRRFEEADVELARDLARRAAIVLDNARLMRDAEQAAARLEARVEERTAQLEAANGELESFAYSVSHDLRSPLRAIEGFSRIVAESTEAGIGEKTRDYLTRIRKNALRMGMLIDDLLQFSRIGRKELQVQPVAPSEVVQQVLAELEPQQEGRTVEWHLHELPPCQADRALLVQVYANLIGNALKFTQQRAVARIEVGARVERGRVVYFVADNGAGFDMRYADQLFGVFQRLHRAEEYEGTGVGLAIVQRIVHRHGGSIWADSTPGEGATFFFTLGGRPAPDATPARP